MENKKESSGMMPSLTDSDASKSGSEAEESENDESGGAGDMGTEDEVRDH